MMIFLFLWVAADTEGGLKGPAQMRRSLQGFGGGSPQQARAGYIPGHCLPATTTFPVAHLECRQFMIARL